MKNSKYIYEVELEQITPYVNEIDGEGKDILRPTDFKPRFDRFLARKYKEKDIEKRKNIISELIGTITSTLVRQSMFAEFERKIHDRIFMEVPTVYTDVTNEYEELLKKYFANITIDEKHKYEWLRIPHFYRPYYVYKYATGISSAIYIARNILNNKEGYLEKYLEMLKTGAKVRKYRCT